MFQLDPGYEYWGTQILNPAREAAVVLNRIEELQNENQYENELICAPT